METPNEKLKRFYSLIDGKEDGAPNTRYKSWEYCHERFYKQHQKLVENPDCKLSESEIDYLSLNLAFYLASWGMYRGSSYLLQRDYKAHYKAVNILMEPQYNCLWRLNPCDPQFSIKDVKKKIFGSSKPKKLDNLPEDAGLYWRIKGSYIEDSSTKKNGNSKKDDASETLTTKIILGTVACLPAFDRFLKSGIDVLKDSSSNLQCKNISTKNIEAYNGKVFPELCEFVKNNCDEFNFNATNPLYPPMKCLDMFLWEIGFEMDIYNAYNTKKQKLSKSKKNGLESKMHDLGFNTMDEILNANK